MSLGLKKMWVRVKNRRTVVVAVVSAVVAIGCLLSVFVPNMLVTYVIVGVDESGTRIVYTPRGPIVVMYVGDKLGYSVVNSRDSRMVRIRCEYDDAAIALTGREIVAVAPGRTVLVCRSAMNSRATIGTLTIDVAERVEVDGGNEEEE